jgi:hypothetical protein
MTRTLLLSILILSTSGCVPGPKMGYSTDQLRQIEVLVEIMRVVYTEARPIWPSEKKDPLEATDYRVLARSGERLEAVATALGEKVGSKRPEGFRKLAGSLRAEAGKLMAAAQGSKAGEAKAAIQEIGKACNACHKEFK